MPNERLRDILPLLRPRSAEPTLFTQTVFYLLCLGIVLIVFLYAFRRYRMRQRLAREFRDLADSLDLSKGEVALVKRAARQGGLTRPERLLTSAQAFERYVGAHASTLARRNLRHPGLAHVARLRQTLGYHGVPEGQSLTSSRQLERGQTMMVWEDWHEEEQHAPWLVLDLDEGSMTLVPLLRGEEEHEDHVEVGDHLALRFWREGDTEYRFHSHVVELDDEAGSYRLEHANRVERMQQRDFFRIDVSFPVCLYALTDGDSQSEPPEVAAEEAAVVLLDRQEDDGAASPDAAAAEGGDDADGAAPLDLDQVERLDCEAVDLSAGGMAVVLTAAEAPRPQRWLVDPEFSGAFPLAGVVCQRIGEKAEAGRLRIKMRFEGLSGAAESEIVRQVYQHQLLQAGGREGAARVDGGRGTSPDDSNDVDPADLGLDGGDLRDLQGPERNT